MKILREFFNYIWKVFHCKFLKMGFHVALFSWIYPYSVERREKFFEELCHQSEAGSLIEEIKFFVVFVGLVTQKILLNVNTVLCWAPYSTFLCSFIWNFFLFLVRSIIKLSKDWLSFFISRIGLILDSNSCFHCCLKSCHSLVFDIIILIFFQGTFFKILFRNLSSE